MGLIDSFLFLLHTCTPILSTSSKKPLFPYTKRTESTFSSTPAFPLRPTQSPTCLQTSPLTPPTSQQHYKKENGISTTITTYNRRPGYQRRQRQPWTLGTLCLRSYHQ